MSGIEGLMRELERLQALGERGDLTVEAGARKALAGKKAVGHRIAMSGLTVRVSGPGAPAVAKQVAAIAGKGAQDALKESLR